MSVKLTLPAEDLSLSLSASLDSALLSLYIRALHRPVRNVAKIQTEDTHAHLRYDVIP